jgi:hypothetical protein
VLMMIHPEEGFACSVSTKQVQACLALRLLQAGHAFLHKQSKHNATHFTPKTLTLSGSLRLPGSLIPARKLLWECCLHCTLVNADLHRQIQKYE